jgi:O-antigen/teichoic acid export membrane protein
LSSGQVLAAIIPFLAGPLLGRIYAPTDYGLLASYTAFVNISASVVTFNYHYGVLTEKFDLNAHRLAFISLSSTVGVAAVMIHVGICIYLVDPFETTTSSQAEWILLLPVSTLVVGASLFAMAAANRAHNYKVIALMLFLAATTGALSSLVLSLYRSWRRWLLAFQPSRPM